MDWILKQMTCETVPRMNFHPPVKKGKRRKKKIRKRKVRWGKRLKIGLTSGKRKR